MKKDFWKLLIDEIKKEQIKPISKSIFILKYFLLWLFFIFSLFVWAISLSIIFWYLFEADWYLYHRVWLIKITLAFLPIFWVIFLLLSSITTFFTFKNTKRWYKFSIFYIFIFNVVFSFILWFLFYFSWFSQISENFLQNNLPKYRELFVNDDLSRMKQVWQNEDKWLLIWEIISVSWQEDVTFRDSNSKIWYLNLSSKTQIKSRVNLDVWEKVKIIWNKIWENKFDVYELRSFLWRNKDN